MKRVLLSLIVIGASLTHGGFAFSQTSKEIADLRREIEALKNGQTAIQKDLLEIKNMLLQRELQALREGTAGRPSAPSQAPSPAPTQVAMINVADAMFKGEKNAKVTLVDFTDYQ